VRFSAARAPNFVVGIPVTSTKDPAKHVEVSDDAIHLYLRRVVRPVGFYHFFMGEFLPIIAEMSQLDPGERSIFVHLSTPTGRRWTIHHSMFDNFLSEFNVQIDPLPRPEYHELLRYDLLRRPWYPEAASDCERAVEWLLSRVGEPEEQTPSVMVQVRHSTARKKQSVIGKYRPRDTRDILDLELLGAALKERFGPSMRVTSNPQNGLPILRQLRTYQSVKTLVLCHGAGMVWGLFVRPDAVLVELVDLETINSRGTSIQALHRIVALTGQKYLVRLVTEYHTQSALKSVDAIEAFIQDPQGTFSKQPVCEGTQYGYPVCPTLAYERKYAISGQLPPFPPSDASKAAPTLICFDNGNTCCRCSTAPPIPKDYPRAQRPQLGKKGTEKEGKKKKSGARRQQ
jgi:hypothetical protein